MCKLTNDAEKSFMNDIIREFILEVIRPDEMQMYINEGALKYASEVHGIYDNTDKFIPHRFNLRCLVSFAPR